MLEGELQPRSETWLNLIAAVTAVATLGLILFSEPIFKLLALAVLR